MNRLHVRLIGGSAQVPLFATLLVLCLLYLAQDTVRASVPAPVAADYMPRLLETPLDTDLIDEVLQGEAFERQLRRALRTHEQRTRNAPASNEPVAQPVERVVAEQPEAKDTNEIIAFIFSRRAINRSSRAVSN